MVNLFIDKILEITDSGAKTSLSVRPDFSFFEGHYPGNPIMPGVLLCESVFQTGAIFLSDHIKNESLKDENVTPVLSRILDTRFKRMVLSGVKIENSVTMKEQMGEFYNLSGEIKNSRQTAPTISFGLALVKDQG